MSSFYFHFYAADHKDYFISASGYVLVHPSLQVSEATLQRVITHCTAAYLIGNEDVGSIVSSEGIELLLGGFQTLFYVGLKAIEEVGKPQGYAVHHHYAPSKIVAAEI